MYPIIFSGIKIQIPRAYISITVELQSFKIEKILINNL